MRADVFQPDAALLPLLPPEERLRYAGVRVDAGAQPDETVLILYGPGFAAFNRAERLMKDAGFSIGQSCAHQPTVCMFGDYEWIAKWKNLTQVERKQAHVLIKGDHRQGPISITLTAACPQEGRDHFLAIAADLSGLC